MSEEKINLLDLVPEDAVVPLNVEGKRKEFELRAVTLADEAWMARTFGDDLQAIFTELKMEPICKIVFHQLKDKSAFAAHYREEYDDNGELKNVYYTGGTNVMAAIQSKRHQFEVIESLLKTIGWSKPILDSEEEEVVKQTKKKPIRKKDRKKA